MGTNRETLPGLPLGEQPAVEKGAVAPIVADTFAGRIHVEWDGSATVTPLGQLPFACLMAGLQTVRCISRARMRRVGATSLGRCFCLCCLVTDAMRTSRRCDATR